MDLANPEDLTHLEDHPFASLFPLMEGEAASKLIASVEQDGLIQPIILFDGMILDGRNRYRACKEGLEQVEGFRTQTFRGTEQEALNYVAAINLTRRHLTKGQRAMVGAAMASLRRGSTLAAEEEGAVSIAAAAEALSVSPFLLKQAKRVRRTAAAHIVAMVQSGEITLSTAEAVAELSARRQAGLKTAEAVKAAAERQRKAVGPFGGYTAQRVLETIFDATREPFARGMSEFVEIATADTLGKLDESIDRLHRLRDALAQANTSTRVTA